jgi:predicted nucleotidyltransferase
MLGQLVVQALAAIRSVMEPQHVVLYSCGEACSYGSRARRTHSPQSDLDFLIVAPSPFPDGLGRRQLLQRLYLSLRALPAAKDLVLVTSEEWHPWADSPSHLVGRAHRVGHSLPDSCRGSEEATQLLRAAEKDWRTVCQLAALEDLEDVVIGAYLDLGDLNPYAV